jgi:hypothetical protein
MTSIEWLEEEFFKLYFTMEIHFKVYEAIEKAKEIHKKEIIDAYNEGFKISGEGFNREYGIQDFKNLSKEIKSEDYYNQIIE